jgi:hypothetical protein
MTLKKLIHVSLMLLLLMIVCACGKTTPRTAAGMINPGDKIGDFLITSGNAENVNFVLDLHCPFNNSTGTASCVQPVGTLVNVGPGVYDNFPFKGKTLDDYWSEHTCDMMIEGRPVNLQAFGSIDLFRPGIGKERVWNVVVVSDNPGTLTIHSKGVVGGYPFDNITLITFKAP